MQRSNLFALGLAASLLAASTALAAPAGDVVSAPHSPENAAVNTSASTSDAMATPTPGANSFTEGQARGRIEKAGYTEVSALTKTSEGFWTGAAMKGGHSVNVSVDFKGVVTAQ